MNKPLLLVFYSLVIILIYPGCSHLKNKSNKEKEHSKTQGKEENSSPELLSPILRKVWIPARIEGERYYDGHYMYVIERGSIWKMK